jgi:uncharacterized protein YfcZ (UPF0381/DUF406 family)
MTKDDIVRMAGEAGFVVDEKAQQHQPNCIFHTHHMVDELLERFAALVAAAEREACADICDQHASIEGIAQRCAAEIRARSHS